MRESQPKYVEACVPSGRPSGKERVSIQDIITTMVRNYRDTNSPNTNTKGSEIINNNHVCPGAMHENAVVADSAYATMAVSIPL